MSRRARRVLGIDTSLRSTGVGIVEAGGPRLRAVEFGCLRMPSALPHSECLRRLSEGIGEVLERCAPEAAAIEGAFYHHNARTAMVLGQARGVAIAACALRGCPVYEYAPRRVKQAVVGFGAAGKEQMQRMVAALLGLAEPAQEDASDALALAICHLHGVTRVTAAPPEPI